MNTLKYLRELSVALALTGFVGCAEPKIIGALKDINPPIERVSQNPEPIVALNETVEPIGGQLVFDKRVKLRKPSRIDSEYLYIRPRDEDDGNSWIFDEQGTCLGIGDVLLSTETGENIGCVYIFRTHGYEGMGILYPSFILGLEPETLEAVETGNSSY